MTTIKDRLVGLLAVLAIAAIIIGLPVVLLALGANPLDGGAPTLDGITSAVTSPDDGTLAVTVIEILGWITWAILTLTLALEILTQITNRLKRGVSQLHAPRLPGLALPQHLAQGLVAVAALLFIGLTVTGTAQPADAAPTAASSQSAGPAAAQNVQAATASSAAAVGGEETPTDAGPVTFVADQTSTHTSAAAPTVTHTVRHGETLWSIAATQLGDGHRYREIVDLNPAQLGGHASFIKAGWVLDIPAPAPQTDTTNQTPGGEVDVAAGDTLSEIALEELGDADRYPEIAEASHDIAQPGGAHLTDPDVIDVGWTVKLPDGSTTGRTGPASAPSEQSPGQWTAPAPDEVPAMPGLEPVAPSGQQAPADAAAPSASDLESVSTAAQENLQEDSDWMVRTSYGVGALLAAGVLTLLAKRRGVQQRRRRPGQQPPTSDARTEQVEQELRATADPLSVETVDTVLRSLAKACTEAGTPLPQVRAARLTSTQFDLYLTAPAQLPAPWVGTEDTTVWTVETTAAIRVDPATVANTPAPYPALVTIGHDDQDGSVFLDLEQLGSLGVTGGDRPTREVLAALAIELATSTWADDLQVTLVGAFPELEDTLQTGRIRYLPSVGRVLENLLARADADRSALASEGATDLQAARVSGTASDAWTPEIVLLTGHITDRQRTQIEQLVDDLPRVALATITSGTSVGEWSLTLDPDDVDQAVLDPIGLTLRPQRLPYEQYGHLLEMVVLSDVDELEGEPVAEPTLADLAAITAEREDPSTDDQAEAPTAPQGAVLMPEVTLQSLTSTAPTDTALPTDTAVTDDTDTTVPTEPDAPEPSVHIEISSAEADVPAARPSAALTDTAAAGDQSTTDDDDSTDRELVAVAAAASPRAHDAVSGPAYDVDEQEHAEHAVDEQEHAEHAVDQGGSLQPLSVPKLLVLGPVDLVNTGGKVEPTRRARLLELAAYLALNSGASHTAIDNAVWPDRKTEDNTKTRNPATTKLRRWVGSDAEGEEYLPRHQSGGYSFRPEVSSDVADWDQLLNQDPTTASTTDLEAAIALVRGIPFEGVHRKRYSWAEPTRERLSREIIDASYELARRRLMDGRWSDTEQASLVGLLVEPAHEPLWRLRILAAHESKHPDAEATTIEALLTVTDRLECDLEPETEQLLADLKTPGAPIAQLITDTL